MPAAKKAPNTKTKLEALLTQIGPRGFNAAIERKLTKLLHSNDADSVENANTLVDLALASKSQNARWVAGEIAGPVLAMHLAAGESLDARIDPLIGLIGGLKELESTYARIPEQRRKAVWEREFGFWTSDINQADAGNPAVDKRYWADHLVDRFEKSFLKKFPEAAPFIERYRSAHAQAKPKPVERRLFNAKKPGAPYVFANPFVVNGCHWDDFNEKERKQLLLAVERMTGKKVKAPSGIARAIDPGMRDDFELRLWEVYAAKPAKNDAPVLDCWVFSVDNAVFFKHGTLERVPVYVLQYSFMGDDGTKESEQLAKDLEASQPTSLWET